MILARFLRTVATVSSLVIAAIYGGRSLHFLRRLRQDAGADRHVETRASTLLSPAARPFRASPCHAACAAAPASHGQSRFPSSRQRRLGRHPHLRRGRRDRQFFRGRAGSRCQPGDGEPSHRAPRGSRGHDVVRADGRRRDSTAAGAGTGGGGAARAPPGGANSWTCCTAFASPAAPCASRPRNVSTTTC